MPAHLAAFGVEVKVFILDPWMFQVRQGSLHRVFDGRFIAGMIDEVDERHIPIL